MTLADQQPERPEEEEEEEEEEEDEELEELEDDEEEDEEDSEDDDEEDEDDDEEEEEECGAVGPGALSPGSQADLCCGPRLGCSRGSGGHAVGGGGGGCSSGHGPRGPPHEPEQPARPSSSSSSSTCALLGRVVEGRRSRRAARMARLVDMWRIPQSKLKPKQMPLIIDEHLAMIMDITGLKALRENPLVQGKQLEEFTKKYNLLSAEERKVSFEVACKDILSVVDQTVPCIGCRRSVERLFYDLSNLNGHPALDPITITYDGLLTIRDEVLQSPQRLCTLLQGHSTRLNELVDRQPRNKKSRRCVLHSLEVQRMRPPQNAWREVWDCMEYECLKEITFIDSDTLDATLDTYLRKHKFCSDCRTKVLLASSLLTTESDPTKEKGYVSSLYADIKRCTGGHVHLPLNTEYISSIIGRAQPDLMGRERHAKTLEIAQEEVLTCLGICVAERLNRIYRRLKEEETMVKVLAAVAVDTLSRNFQMAVDYKQGITQLEVLYKEFKREEVAKQQRREKLRLKKKKKKERRAEMEGKENQCDEKEDKCECPQIETEKKVEAKEKKESVEILPPKPELDSVVHVDRHKLQVLDPKMKGLPTCNCPDCTKKTKNSNQAQTVSNQSATSTPNKKDKKNKKKTPDSKSAANNNSSSSGNNNNNNNNNINNSNSNAKKAGKREKSDKSVPTSNNSSNSTSNSKDSAPTAAAVATSNAVESPKSPETKKTSDQRHSEVSKRLISDECKNPSPSAHLMEEFMDINKKYTMWIEVKKRLNTKALNRNGRSSSENSSQDYGYSSEHNLSSSSLPSTPEGSEVACSEGCCGREGDCRDARSADKLSLSDTSLGLLKGLGGGLMLSQMLEDDSEDEGNCSYIPVEEVLEFKSRMCQVTEKRRELRQTLQKRFAALCNNSHHKPFTIPR